MKKELFKVSYERYHNDEYYDTNSISDNEGRELEYNKKKQIRAIFNNKGFDELEETYTKNYGNPLYSIQKEHCMIVVERDDDKVSIKCFYGIRKRSVGCSWFKVNKHLFFVTANIRTGDVYNGSLNNYQKKKCQKRLKRNFWAGDPINNMKLTVKNYIKHFNPKSDEYETAIMALSTFMFELDQRQDFGDLNFSERLYRFYLNKRGIKYPNNFGAFLKTTEKLPILKDFRKNENKYVETFMAINGITGKKVRKVLHLCTAVNLSVYRIALKFFGEDWINQNEEVLLACLNSPYKPWFSTETNLRDVFSLEELKRVFEIFKQAFVKETLEYSTFFDHIRFYIELKVYGEEDLRWQSSDNKEEFRQEHLDWTDKLQHYKQGTYTRVYPEYIHDIINKPIQVGEDTYYPVLLTNSSVYNQESISQSNCVKGYIGKVGSIIVSLRKNDIESDDRGTVQYVLNKVDDKVFALRVQNLGRFNGKLGEEWNEALNHLDNKLYMCVIDKKYENVKLKKECTNGVILHSDSKWDDNGALKWTCENIENGYTSYNFNLDF